MHKKQSTSSKILIKNVITKTILNPIINHFYITLHFVFYMFLLISSVCKITSTPTLSVQHYNALLLGKKKKKSSQTPNCERF